MMRRLEGLWLLALCIVGCTHTPLPIPPQSMDAYPFRQVQAGVKAAVDPYFTTDRLQVAFSGGDEFPQNGLLPVRVIIENGSPGAIQVDPRAFRLQGPGRALEQALSPQDALALVKKSVGWWAVGAGFVGGSAPAYQNEGRLKSLEARALKEETLPQGGSATGFVYFPIADDAKSLAGSRVIFAVVGPEGRALVFEILVDGRRDLPISAPKVETVERAKPPAPTPLNPQNPQSPVRIEGAGGQGVIIRSPTQ